MGDLHIDATLALSMSGNLVPLKFSTLTELKGYLDSGNFRYIEGHFNGVYVNSKDLDLILNIFG